MVNYISSYFNSQEIFRIPLYATTYSMCVYIDASSLGNCLVFGHCSLRECANSFIRVPGFVS